ncbi:MAG: hypothetical protein C0409_12720, partial [Novosphingobium sp.]|nr:hypothetical protein [Novosphingobium sp.]
LRIVLWLAIMGAAIEVLQAIPALRRTADWRDWVADVAAIVCGLIPAQVFRRLAARTGQA